ncbi:MAG: redoxin domain-containing protein [Acidobacteria bacterium]|nr:redoxin domain-containing protein [Acidobacteriota bacterium]
MELQSRYADLQARGLGLAVITYDSTDTLAGFAETRGIEYPLLSDAGSETIRAFDLLNRELDPASAPAEQREMMERLFGVPYPGTFLLDPDGRVSERYFEPSYQERFTVSSIAVRLGNPLEGTDRDAVRVETDHLTAEAWVTDDVVAPGNRFSLVVDVTPKPEMHVYAPGDHSYQVIRLRIDEPEFARAHDVAYPDSEIYHFVPLDERVEVYESPFRLVQEVTIPMSREIAGQAAAPDGTVTISGALEYQACDHEICYVPAEIPLTWTLDWRPLLFE